jgi:hypothetical protein
MPNSGDEPFDEATLAQVMEYLLIIKSRNPFRDHVYGMLMCSSHVQLCCVSDPDYGQTGFKMEFGNALRLLAENASSGRFSVQDGLALLAGFLIALDNSILGYYALPTLEFGEFYQVEAAKAGSSAAYIGFTLPLERSEALKRIPFDPKDPAVDTCISKLFRRDRQVPSQKTLPDTIVDVDQDTGVVTTPDSFERLRQFISTHKTKYQQLAVWFQEVSILLRLREKLESFQSTYGQLFPTLRKFGVHNGQGWLILNEVCVELTGLDEADIEHLRRIPKALAAVGVVDRDIRPANIMRCRKTKLPMKIDFGFAVECLAGENTEPLPVYGTVKYASNRLVEALHKHYTTGGKSEAFTYCYSHSDNVDSIEASSLYFKHRDLLDKYMPRGEQVNLARLNRLINARNTIARLVHAHAESDQLALAMFQREPPTTTPAKLPQLFVHLSHAP